MKPGKLVLFDVDHTLVDVGLTHAEAFAKAFVFFYGISLPPESFQRHGCTDLQIIHEVLKESGQKVHPEKVAKMISFLISEFEKKDLSEARLFDGVKDILSALKENGCIIGLVTGNIEKIAHTKLNHFGIDQYFLLGGFGEISVMRADLVRKAMQEAEAKGHKFDKTDVYVVGDTPNDIRAAKEAGAGSNAVAQGKNGREELEKESPDYLFRGLHEIKRITDVIMNG